MNSYPVLSDSGTLANYATQLDTVQLSDNRIYVKGNSSATVDGVMVVSVSGSSEQRWLLTNTTLNARWFGALGNGSRNDTNELQAWLTAGVSYGRALYLPSGTYIVEGTSSLSCDISDSKNLNIKGDGAATTILSYTGLVDYVPVFFIAGDTNLTPKSISGIQFDGDANSLGIVLQNVTAVKISDCRFNTNLVGVRFQNNGKDRFTEQNVIYTSTFEQACKYGIQYTRVNSGDESFRGNGLQDCTANIGPGNALILIDEYCKPYFSPLTVTCWTHSTVSTTCSVIHNQSTLQPDFYGTLSVEPMGKDSSKNIIPITTITGQLVHISGQILTNDQAVSTGPVKLWTRLQRNSIGSISGNLQPTRTRLQASGGNNPGSVIANIPYAALVVIQVSATNYEYKKLYSVCHYGDGNNQGACVLLSNFKAHNGAGWTIPDFTVGMAPNADLMIFNENYTSSNSVIVEVSITALADITNAIPLTP